MLRSLSRKSFGSTSRSLLGGLTGSNTKDDTQQTLGEQRSNLATGLTSIRGSIKLEAEDDTAEDYWQEIDVKKLRTRELRAALEARGLSTAGSKKVLQARLQQSVHEEKEEELEYLTMVEAARRAETALEESGSVYTCGLNRTGQLGLGDREDRSEFIVVKELRGKGIMQVAAGGDIAMALSENGNVFMWGGIGTGRSIQREEESKFDSKVVRKRKKKAAMEQQHIQTALEGVSETGLTHPRLVEALQGEGIVHIATGPNHSGAISDGGDLYMWGDGTRGQLGTGGFSIEMSPVLIESLQDVEVVRDLVIGQTHTMILGNEDDLNVYSFGFSNSGKLGLGITERMGIKPPLNRYFPEPTMIESLAKIHVRLISCSANHSALVADEGLFTWGSGDGGRLGHGDHKDRTEPTLVEDLQGQVVIDIGLGFWHSAAIVQVPPQLNGGWLYTWGSGYHGQLAQGDETCLTRPMLSQVVVDLRLLFLRISVGPTHCLAQTIDGDLYSWGSNAHGELAREMQFEEDIEREYTAIPGFIPGFNKIVDRIGRGQVISFAAGKNFSIVATSKYTGETEEEQKIREEEEEMQRLEEEEEREYRKLLRQEREAQKEVEDLTKYDGNGCDLCKDECPGFEANIFRPNECKECGHKRKRHTIQLEEPDFAEAVV